MFSTLWPLPWDDVAGKILSKETPNLRRLGMQDIGVSWNIPVAVFSNILGPMGCEYLCFHEAIFILIGHWHQAFSLFGMGGQELHIYLGIYTCL